MTPNNTDALSLLSVLIESKMEKGANKNQACIPIAKKLGYSRPYVINMYTNQKVTPEAAKKIKKALTPKPPRHRVQIEVDNPEDKKKILNMSMDERVRRLLDE